MRSAGEQDSSLPSHYPNMPQTIAVLDFGSQYTQVIARQDPRVPGLLQDLPLLDARRRRSGGRRDRDRALRRAELRLLAERAHPRQAESSRLGVPVLGICYGIQLMGHMLGGKVARGERREYGHGTLEVRTRGRLFSGLPKKLRVWNSHGDKLMKLPPGFAAIGRTENSPYAAIEDLRRGFYGIQFHPEVFHTERGIDILNNFLVGRLPGQAGLDDQGLHRARRPGDPGGGGQVARHPGPVGRRRLLGRGRPDPQGDRPPAHVRLRRQRAPAQGRAGDG